MSIHSIDQSDLQPFAFESRDFIRTKLVGKVIQFRVLYTIPMKDGSKRDFCQITLQDGNQLPDLSVAQGYLKLRDEAGSRESSDEVTSYIDKLRALEARAKADNRGLWDAAAPKAQTSHELSDPTAFVEKWRGKPIDGMVKMCWHGAWANSYTQTALWNTSQRAIASLLDCETRKLNTTKYLSCSLGSEHLDPNGRAKTA